MRALLKLVPWLLAPLALSSCGWYTNAPAAVRVLSMDPSTVDVRLSATAAAVFTNPKVTLAVENGSIGATFTKMEIHYFDTHSGSKTALSEIDLPAAYMSLRVEGSTAKATAGDRPLGQPLEMTGGTSAQATIPLVNDVVIAKAKSDKIGLMTADVVLTGVDDANYTPTIHVYVPITFTGF